MRGASAASSFSLGIADCRASPAIGGLPPKQGGRAPLRNLKLAENRQTGGGAGAAAPAPKVDYSGSSRRWGGIPGKPSSGFFGCSAASASLIHSSMFVGRSGMTRTPGTRE